MNPTETDSQPPPTPAISFRWTYILLPLVLLALVIVLTAVFYNMLPDELAYRLQDGSPDRLFSRGSAVGWLVVPQVFCALLSFIVVRITLMGARYWTTEASVIGRVLPLMGNMLALPQVILLYVTIDIFIYNIYEVRLMPLWIFAVIILALGGIILAVYFYRTVRQARRLFPKASRNKTDDR